MSLRRRAASAAVALTALFSVAACTEADNGNNTLAGVSQAPATPGASDASAPGGAPSSAPGAPQTTAPAKAGDDIELEAKDNEFVPLEITAKAGTFTIVMKNTGQAPHTFTQKDLNVDVNADPGKTAKIKIENAKPGKYHFICIYHLSVKMEGDLTVT